MLHQVVRAAFGAALGNLTLRFRQTVRTAIILNAIQWFYFLAFHFQAKLDCFLNARNKLVQRLGLGMTAPQRGHGSDIKSFPVSFYNDIESLCHIGPPDRKVYVQSADQRTRESGPFT